MEPGREGWSEGAREGWRETEREGGSKGGRERDRDDKVGERRTEGTELGGSTKHFSCHLKLQCNLSAMEAWVATR